MGSQSVRLVDSHVHLALDSSDDPVGHLAERDDTAAFVAMPRAARLAARGGVTTVHDLGDRGYLVLAIRDAAGSDRSLPTAVAAGLPITTPGGHCHYLGGTANGVDGVSAVVRTHAERGIHVIKIMIEEVAADLAAFRVDRIRCMKWRKIRVPISRGKLTQCDWLPFGEKSRDGPWTRTCMAAEAWKPGALLGFFGVAGHAFQAGGWLPR